MDIFVRITEWIKGEVKGAWKIASRVCLTVFRVFNVISFLEKVKLIDMGPVVSKLSTIPVIGWIVNLPVGLIGIFAFGLGTVNNSIQVAADSARKRIQENIKQALVARRIAINPKADAMDIAIQKNKYEVAHNAIQSDKALLSKLKDHVDLKRRNYTVLDQNQIQAQWNTRSQPNYATDASLDKRIKRANLQVNKITVERGKTIVGLINDAIKVAVIALFLIGSIVGGILAATSIFMLSASLAAASIGFYKVFHDKFAKMSVENTKADIARI